MITLNASGGSITFEFSGNSTYLNDGTITVPVNSLALIIDESDMISFKKASSNDIFVSANIAEFGMTKAELESWYKENMVGSTGGGGGVTSGEVQTMIDESISGKADSLAVTQEITAAVSGKADSSSLATVATSGSYDDLTNKPTIPTVPTSNTAFTNDAGYITSDALSGYAESSAVTEEISAAVSGKVDTNTYTAYTANTQTVLNSKLDATAYTPTVVDAALSQSSTNPVQNQALYSELRIGGGETETTLVIENNHSTNYPEGCTKIKVEVVGSNNYTTINFVDNDAQNLGTMGVYNYGSISVDTSYFQAATYEISGTTVIISYPTVTNVTKIQKSGDANYVYKAVTTEPPIPLKDAISGKVDTTTYTAYTADTTPKVNAAWQEGVKAPSLGYDTISGITLSSLPISGGYNYNYSSIATDDSLKSDNESVLGVYATGDTHVVSINPTERNNTVYLRVDKKPFNIKMYWNSSYTGNTTHNIAVNCIVNDGTNGYCQWNWDGSQYNPRSDYNNTAVTLSYDSTNQVVTITPSSSSALDYIKYVKCNRYIAPSSALTQEDCRISAVTIDTNSYKLQEALDNKQDTLSAGTGISISGNVISATGGGGKAIEAGRGITVTIGATADTVSLNVPISEGIGHYSIQENGGTAFGEYSHAEGFNTMTTLIASVSHAEGYSTVAGGEASHAEGVHTSTNNLAEHASGRYNKSSISSTTFGDSGNTLFSVGNGTSSADTHNAFEIRQNGDIYFEYDGNDIKLQDKLDEIESVTARALVDLDDRFGGLKLQQISQSDYDALVSGGTVDASTLYVIVN